MAITAPEVVKANLVLVGFRLLSAQNEIEAFRRAVGTDVRTVEAGLAVNVQSGLTEPLIGLALNKDRIALELAPARSTISRDYPQREDFPRLAEVAWQAIKNTSIGEQQLRAYGFNIEMVLDQDSGTPAFEYLSKRLFDVGPLGNDGWQFVGGAGKLIFSDSGRRWTINLEPRFNDETESRIFLNGNLHEARQDTPTADQIRESLEELWDEMCAFGQRLDKRES